MMFAQFVVQMINYESRKNILKPSFFSKLRPILGNAVLMKMIRVNESYIYFFPFKETTDHTPESDLLLEFFKFSIVSWVLL